MGFFKNSNFGEQNEISEEEFERRFEELKIKDKGEESVEIDKKKEEENLKLFNKIKNNKEYSKEQIEAIEIGLNKGINLNIISNKNFSALKIKELIKTYELGDNPEKYLDMNFLQLRYIINSELNKFKKAEKEDVVYQLGPEQAKVINFKMDLFDIINSVLFTKGSYAIVSDLNNRLIINYMGYVSKDGKVRKQCTVSEGVGAEIKMLYAFIIDSEKNINGKIIEKTKGSYEKSCAEWSEKSYKKEKGASVSIDEKIAELQQESYLEKAKAEQLRREFMQKYKK